MKKMIALLIAIALAVSAVALPALAEEASGTTVDQVSSATVQAGKAGRGGQRQIPGNRQAPQQPGQKEQTPQQPDQNGQSGQQQAPDNNQQNGRQVTPGRGNRNIKPSDRNANSRRTGKTGNQAVLDQMLKDGVITQDVYDAIINYLNSLAAPQQTTESSSDSTGTT